MARLLTPRDSCHPEKGVQASRPCCALGPPVVQPAGKPLISTKQPHAMNVRLAEGRYQRSLKRMRWATPSRNHTI
jgi:hypothetical protein